VSCGEQTLFRQSGIQRTRLKSCVFKTESQFPSPVGYNKQITTGTYHFLQDIVGKREITDGKTSVQGIRRRNNGGKGSFSQYEIYYNGDMKSRIGGGGGGGKPCPTGGGIFK
jgi:hypothetical protein